MERVDQGHTENAKTQKTISETKLLGTLTFKLPEDWALNSLDDLAVRGSGHTPDKKFEAYYNGGIKWVSLADSNRLDQGLISQTEIEISNLGVQNSSAIIHPAGTVLMSRDAGVGKSAIMGLDMAVSQHFIVWRCKENLLDNWYLYYWLQFNKQYFERQAVGSTIKTIGLPLFRKLKLAHPSYFEQRAIAQVLSTADAAIHATEKLIAQKEQRKKWLMQQLLTGKKRLPGFEGEWLKLGAGEIFSSVSKRGYVDEKLLSATQDKGMIPRTMLEGRVTMPTTGTEGFKLVESGDFVISLRSFQGGLEYSYFRGLVSPAYTVLKPTRTIDEGFYKQYFKSYEFIGRLATAVIGIRDGKQISYDDFCSVKIPYPRIEEQIAIAQVLTAADKEINLLKAKAEKLREQKKGLMRVLLTGKVRLKIN